MSNNGTLIKTRYPVIYFDNFDISSLEGLKYKKEDISKNIEDIKKELMSLCMSTPKDIYNSEEYNSPFDYIKEKFSEIYDSLAESLYDIHQLDFMENLIDEWDYSCYSKERELYENDIKNAFREDKKSEINYIDKPRFNFSPNDKSILDIFNRAKNNVEFNRKNIDFLKDKYVILFDGEIFSTETDQFIFSSEENAKKVIYDKFDLRIFDYLNKEFINSNREFFMSFHNILADNEYIELMDYINIIEESEANKDSNYMTILQNIYDLIQKGIDLMFDKHIKIIKLSDLVNSVEK